MTKIRTQKIENLVYQLKKQHKHEAIRIARSKQIFWEMLIGIFAFAMPLVLTIVISIIQEKFNSNDCFKWPLIVIATLVAIAIGFVFYIKSSNYAHVCNALSDDANLFKEEIKELKQKIWQQASNAALMNGFMNNFCSQNTNGKVSVDSLGQEAAMSIYSDCQRRFNNTCDLTVNIYIAGDNKIAMVGHHQGVYSSSAPYLFGKPFPGVDINDPNIKDYQCVKMLLGNDDTKELKDWIKIKNNFRWRQRDKRNFKTRAIYKAEGLTYNQYIGLRTTTPDHMATIIEIISHNDTQLASPDELEVLSRELLLAYIPLATILLVISDK